MVLGVILQDGKVQGDGHKGPLTAGQQRQGLLCTLESEDELAAIIANEMSHFVLDHQVKNIYRAERRAKRAALWGTGLAVTAEVALEVAYWDDDDTALGVGAVASIGSIAALLNVNVVNRLGTVSYTHLDVYKRQRFE